MLGIVLSLFLNLTFEKNEYVVCAKTSHSVIVSDLGGNVWEYEPTDKDEIVDMFQKDGITLVKCNNGTPNILEDDWFVDGSLWGTKYEPIEFRGVYLGYWYNEINPYFENEQQMVDFGNSFWEE